MCAVSPSLAFSDNFNFFGALNFLKKKMGGVGGGVTWNFYLGDGVKWMSSCWVHRGEWNGTMEEEEREKKFVMGVGWSSGRITNGACLLIAHVSVGYHFWRRGSVGVRSRRLWKTRRKKKSAALSVLVLTELYKSSGPSGIVFFFSTFRVICMSKFFLGDCGCLIWWLERLKSFNLGERKFFKLGKCGLIPRGALATPQMAADLPQRLRRWWSRILCGNI